MRHSAFLTAAAYDLLGLSAASTTTPPHRPPDDRGRRAEKDATALAKAEAKRQRKAAKRARRTQHETHKNPENEI